MQFRIVKYLTVTIVVLVMALALFQLLFDRNLIVPIVLSSVTALILVFIFNTQVTHLLRLSSERIRDAKAESEAKGSFLANMSHEIRTPMNGILGMISLTLDSRLSEEQREQLGTALNSGESLLSILNDILDVSKSDAGKMQLEHIEFDVHLLIEEVVDLVSEITGAKDIEIASLIASELPFAIKGDPTRIRQILNNLISNAVKFTRKGEVLVRASYPSKNLMRVEVSDTGIGISEEAQARVFESYSQAEDSTARQFGGTGLGLTLCKKLVGLMGGEIGIRSTLGQGTTFWFTVPIEISENNNTKDLSARQENILVVSDCATSNTVLAHYMDSWNMPITIWHDARVDSPHELEADNYPLVVVEVVQVEDAIEAISRCMQFEQIRCARYIALCARIDHKDRLKLEESGYSGFLNKPIRLSKLHALFTPSVLPGELVQFDFEDDLKKEPVKDYEVLVVDDNLVNQKVAQGMLKKLGCRVQVVSNGLDAVEILHNKIFDLVFMDCQMPVMDGLEATRKIRKTHAEANKQYQPIVAMTAHVLDEHRAASKEAGMDDHITKPIASKELTRMLDTWCIDNRGFQANPPAH